VAVVRQAMASNLPECAMVVTAETAGLVNSVAEAALVAEARTVVWL
jgi:hypothetical protein